MVANAFCLLDLVMVHIWSRPAILPPSRPRKAVVRATAGPPQPGARRPGQRLGGGELGAIGPGGREEQRGGVAAADELSVDEHPVGPPHIAERSAVGVSPAAV